MRANRWRMAERLRWVALRCCRCPLAEVGAGRGACSGAGWRWQRGCCGRRPMGWSPKGLPCRTRGRTAPFWWASWPRCWASIYRGSPRRCFGSSRCSRYMRGLRRCVRRRSRCVATGAAVGSLWLRAGRRSRRWSLRRQRPSRVRALRRSGFGRWAIIATGRSRFRHRLVEAAARSGATMRWR